MLTFDPCDRITASDAMMHPYLSTYAQSSDEPISFRPFRIEEELDDVTEVRSDDVCCWGFLIVRHHQSVRLRAALEPAGAEIECTRMNKRSLLRNRTYRAPGESITLVDHVAFADVLAAGRFRVR